MRIVLKLLLLVGVLRCIVFIGYAIDWSGFLHETHPTEAKIVNLAWRVQAGLTLYPEWTRRPHVANFFSPVYFWLVGGLGRCLDSSLEQLFTIGRAVTLVSAGLCGVAIFCYLYRRQRLEAATAGAIFSIGAAPMYGFAVMARPDVLADTFGVCGYLLLISWNRRVLPAAGLLLALACLTKQTAGIYLLAAIAACLCQRARRESALAAVSVERGSHRGGPADAPFL